MVECLDAVVEADGVADVAGPVVGVDFLGVDEGAGEVGGEGNGGWVVGEFCRGGAELGVLAPPLPCQRTVTNLSPNSD